ncbi:MAG: D-aminoacylase [Actinobacteria bacterium]|nr:D-aminoacylase [Actinomycetota bacterium]
MHDCVFRDARVVDGDGRPPAGADVAVESGRVAAVGDLGAAPARRVVDVGGRVLAPGFIDLHTHSDFTLPRFPRAQSMVRQGVTTQLVGNCGFSTFPVATGRVDLLRDAADFLDAGLEWDWTSAAEYAAMLDALPLACNVALQVGHGAVRTAVMGFDTREPGQEELSRMQALVAEALDQGAFGLSTGLIYPPSSYAATDELVAVAAVAARHGAFYSSHLRGEGDTLLEAVDEALLVGRRARVPVQLSHHKASGRANWGLVEASLARIDRARAGGHDVLADQYPYTAASTTLTTIVPQWAMADGAEGLQCLLAEPGRRARLARELDAAGAREFDLDSVMIASVPGGADGPVEGRMLTDIAEERGRRPLDVALDLLERHGGGVEMVVFAMSEDDVRTVMRHPAVAVASDGWTLSPEAGGKPHPRSYGTYARVLGTYVRQEGVLTLEEAVRKMTSLPARRLGRDDLGLVRPGCAADLVVFDPDRVADRATYAEPHRFCDGVDHVVVGGRLVVEDGADTGEAAGRVLRRGV